MDTREEKLDTREEKLDTREEKSDTREELDAREGYLDLNETSLGEKYIFSKNPKPIGRGGSGIVYKVNQVFGKDASILSVRAVKFFIFRENLFGEYGIVSVNNFHTEIKNITKFNHQNILKVIEGDYYNVEINGENVNIPYTITEYIEGKNLEELLSDDNKDLCQQYIKDEETIFDIFFQIADALSYLHNNNFYHCDVAPKNIFLKMGTNDDVFAVLGDLGAGKTVGSDIDKPVRVIGSRDYMPDEVKEFKNREIPYEQFMEFQPAWDMYSIIHTFQKVIRKLKENKIFNNQTWNLDRFSERIADKTYNNVGELKNDIIYFRPSSGKIYNLDELSEASNNIIPCLIPCGEAMLSRRIRKLTKHDGMLRLMEVPQLLEGATTFPGANHTRYEHSLGTYELMRKALVILLRNDNYMVNLSQRQVVLALLGALLSSLANFPYSYAIQELRLQNPGLFVKLERRGMFKQLINTKSELSGKSIADCIGQLFDEFDINDDDIAYVIFGKKESRNKELDNLHFLLNSSIGVRIIDYIMRDAHHIGISCRIDTDNLFNNISIRDGEFCLRQGGISSAEQIITNRSWMFKRIYWSDPNRANAALLKYLFYIAYCSNDKIDEIIAKDVFNSNKKSIQDILIDNCAEEKKSEIEEIIKFINHRGQTRYKSILVLDDNSDYRNASLSCAQFYNMDYENQNKVREQLEQNFMEHFSIPKDKLTKGAVILIDIPVENMGNKIGKDIRVQRHDGHMTMLDKASGLVSGMYQNYEQQLRILRVYVRPDILDLITEEKKVQRSALGKIVNDMLCDIV